MDKPNDKHRKVLKFLKQSAVFGLDFTETGIKNICNRFGISPEELQTIILQLQNQIQDEQARKTSATPYQDN